MAMHLICNQEKRVQVSRSAPYIPLQASHARFEAGVAETGMLGSGVTGNTSRSEREDLEVRTLPSQPIK